MGNLCSHHSYKHPEDEALESEGEAGDLDEEGDIHCLVCGIDYKCDHGWAGEKPLDTRDAFDFMVDLCQKSGAKTVHTLWNEQCTREGFKNGIAYVGNECQENDTFVFYYTGHGDRLKDKDGDEESGFDSAFCLLGRDGNVEPRDQVWLTDDEFVDDLHASVDPETKILVLCDCCHSGTMMDVTKPAWTARGYTACSLSGCTDKQTSAGTGKGGMFSRALTCAIQDMQQDEEKGYTVATLYNRTLAEYQKRKNQGHTQKITIHGCGLPAKEFIWPLQPQVPYRAPANAGYVVPGH